MAVLVWAVSDSDGRALPYASRMRQHPEESATFTLAAVPATVIVAVVAILVTSVLALPIRLIPVAILAAGPSGLGPAPDAGVLAASVAMVLIRTLIEVVAAVALLRRSAAARAVLTAGYMATFVEALLVLSPDLYDIGGFVVPIAIAVGVIVLLHVPASNRWLTASPSRVHPQRPRQVTFGSLISLVWSLPVLVVACFFIAGAKWTYRALQSWYSLLFPSLIGGDIAMILGVEMVVVALPAVVAGVAALRRGAIAPPMLVISAAVAIGFTRQSAPAAISNAAWLSASLAAVAIAALLAVVLLHSRPALGWLMGGPDLPATEAATVSR